MTLGFSLSSLARRRNFEENGEHIAMTAEPTVFVVDDDAGVAEALQDLLKYAGFRVEYYADARAFLDNCDPNRPGCLVLDARMPIMSGLVLLEKLPDYAIRLPVIVLTGHGDITMVARAMQNGAFEFLEKPFDNRILIEAVHNAIAQDAERRRCSTRKQAIEQRLALLSEREQEVLEGLLAGHAHKRIAADLDVSLSTIEAHRKSIQQKLQAHNLADLLYMVMSCRRSGD